MGSPSPAPRDDHTRTNLERRLATDILNYPAEAALICADGGLRIQDFNDAEYRTVWAVAVRLLEQTGTVRVEDLVSELQDDLVEDLLDEDSPPWVPGTQTAITREMTALIAAARAETAARQAKHEAQRDEPKAKAQAKPKLEAVPAPTPAPTDLERAVHPLDLSAVLSVPPPKVHWVWDGYLPLGTSVMLNGDGGAGKTILGLAISAAICSGSRFLDRQAAPGHVLYLDAENPLDEVHRRVHRFFTPDMADAFHLYRIERQIGVRVDFADWLEREILAREARLCVVDSQRGVWGGDENDQAKVRGFYMDLNRISERTRSCILVIHHDNKLGSYSGSSDLHNAPSGHIMLKRPDPTLPTRELHHMKARVDREQPIARYRLGYDVVENKYTFGKDVEDAGLRERVLDLMESDLAKACGYWLSKDQVRKVLNIRAPKAEQLLATMADQLELRESPMGPHGETGLYYAHPRFVRDASDPADDPTGLM